MFGITLGTYDSFDKLYDFLMKTKDTALKALVDNVQKTVDQDHYGQLIKTVAGDM